MNILLATLLIFADYIPYPIGVVTEPTRIQSWELNYAITICDSRGGIDYIDVYDTKAGYMDNFVTCEDGITFKMEMTQNQIRS